MRDLDELSEMNTLRQIMKVIRETLDALNCPNLVVTAEFNGRFSSRMGDANWTQKRVRFSKPLWPRATKQERYQVIVHEVAHIVAEERYGRGIGRRISPHGYQWKLVMLEMGLHPDRCHSVPTAGVANKKAKYKTYCRCSGENALHLVTKKVYDRIADPLCIRSYTCRRCKARLTTTPQN